MHCVHLGGFWRQQLMSNDVRGKSYYEVLDVLFKVSEGPGLYDLVRARLALSLLLAALTDTMRLPPPTLAHHSDCFFLYAHV